MPIRLSSRVAGQLQTLFSVGASGDLSDGQLLERFVTSRNEAAELAFAALVERHGPMVLRVCRGILADPNDRDDAFQATFLVLVKKARGLWVRDSLGPWLHQVAFRTATALKSSSARRLRLEKLAAHEPAEIGRDAHDEIGPALHEEIERLPERFRLALILCDLEGRSHEQAARYLGWPIGTVKSRQSRGRERLRERLLRRGITADAGHFALVFSQTTLDKTIPRALMESTIRAAVGSLTRQTLVSGTATALAQGVLRSMFMTYGFKVVTVILGVGLTVSGVGVFVGQDKAGVAVDNDDDPSSIVVKPAKLSFIVSERGNLESSSNDDVYCRVEGTTTIMSIVPEGTRVDKGQLVCELDASALKAQLTNQVFATKAAEAAYQNAKLNREVAEIAVVEYAEGVLKSELRVLKGEIDTTRDALTKAQERLKRSQGVKDRLIASQKNVPDNPTKLLAELDLADRIDAAELAIARERAAMELAERKLAVLEKYTAPRTITSLKTEIEKARSQELAKQATWELEKSKEAKLNRQIANCRIVAPRDGLMVYANDPNRSPAQIEEGATLRERQKIFSLPDLSEMQVDTKIEESIVDQIVPGLQVKIKVDAFPNEECSGSVVDVAPLPDPSNFFRSDVKVYTAHVKIEKGLPGFRPGMTAAVEIFVKEQADALSVPVQTVFHGKGDGRDRILVKKAQGLFELREVKLGMNNGKSVEVKEGLKAGERVVLQPTAIMAGAIQLRSVDLKDSGAPAKNGAGERDGGTTKAKAKAKSKGARGGVFFQKFQNIPAEERAKMKSASREEREAIMKKAGFTDEEIKQMNQMRQDGGTGPGQ